MNNINIIQLEHFNLDTLKNILAIENPIYQGNTNYFSKLILKETKKNLYFQLPKTKSKQGFVINGTKKYIEFIYTKNDKYIFSFIENLESFLIEEILKNKDMWFYNSDTITYDDIENIMMPITKSYKNGNNILFKTYFNQNKLVIYNENKEIIDHDKFSANDYIIPLINVNGIKFSNKNFVIDINLVQLLVISDEEELTNSLLINISNENQKPKYLEKKNLKEEELKEENIIDIIDITNNMTTNDKDSNYINIKSRENIYLEMYNDAITKAISLKKTAIESFLKAKKIKNDYDLGNLIKVNNSDSLSDFEDLDNYNIT